MGIAKYIVNIDEFAQSFQDIVMTPELSTESLEQLFREKLDEIIALLKQLIQPNQNQTFKSVDMSKHIPAIVNTFIISKNFEQDVYLTGITFSQTAWKPEDTLSLELNGNLIIDQIHTKELGQQKFFNAFIPVKAGEEVRILYHNTSGNSKMLFCDLDYILIDRKDNNYVI